MPLEDQDLQIGRLVRLKRVGRPIRNQRMAKASVPAGKQAMETRQDPKSSFAAMNTSLLQLQNAMSHEESMTQEDGIFNTSQLESSRLILDTSKVGGVNESAFMNNPMDESTAGAPNY